MFALTTCIHLAKICIFVWTQTTSCPSVTGQEKSPYMKNYRKKTQFKIRNKQFFLTAKYFIANQQPSGILKKMTYLQFLNPESPNFRLNLVVSEFCMMDGYYLLLQKKRKTL